LFNIIDAQIFEERQVPSSAGHWVAARAWRGELPRARREPSASQELRSPVFFPIEALKESPAEFLVLVLRLVGDWPKDAFGGE